MTSKEKFSLLRTILHTLGLSKEASEDIIERISDWLSDKEEDKSLGKAEFPYFVRDDFLSAAELSFYLVLKTVVAEQVLILTKVSLGDLFYAKSGDHSKYRIYTNKIDRKHVDFLLCDPKTVRPLLGIELDDKSHQRQDRQERDDFVQHVFLAAKLPLLRIPAKRSYSTSELSFQVLPYLSKIDTSSVLQPIIQEANTNPSCPKCGSEMVLRTAKSGANEGNKFWGCSSFPKCHGILKFEV